MKRTVTAMMLMLSLLLAAQVAEAGWGARAVHGSRWGVQAAGVGQSTCWHNNYYYVPWGAPTALVVPPTADTQTHWGWGVGNTRVTPVYHQFQRDWPGPGNWNPRSLRPTPPWPSDTDQFGVNYVRGPW